MPTQLDLDLGPGGAEVIHVNFRPAAASAPEITLSDVIAGMDRFGTGLIRAAEMVAGSDFGRMLLRFAELQRGGRR